jgi:DNA-binding MltR family transcriptional regulator
MGRRALQTIPDLTEDATRLVEDLQRETDRGAALLAAAFLDDVLELLLRAAFVDDQEAINKLLSAGRPLESFGTRSHVAWCTGLLGQDIYADLNLIREIRNDYAHRHPTSFEAVGIRDKCKRLKCVSVLVVDDECTARHRFIASVALIANHLILAASNQTHAVPARDFARNGVLRLK